MMGLCYTHHVLFYGQNFLKLQSIIKKSEHRFSKDAAQPFQPDNTPKSVVSVRKKAILGEYKKDICPSLLYSFGCIQTNF